MRLIVHTPFGTYQSKDTKWEQDEIYELVRTAARGDMDYLMLTTETWFVAIPGTQLEHCVIEINTED